MKCLAPLLCQRRGDQIGYAPAHSQELAGKEHRRVGGCLVLATLLKVRRTVLVVPLSAICRPARRSLTLSTSQPYREAQSAGAALGADLLGVGLFVSPY